MSDVKNSIAGRAELLRQRLSEFENERATLIMDCSPSEAPLVEAILRSTPHGNVSPETLSNSLDRIRDFSARAVSRSLQVQKRYFIATFLALVAMFAFSFWVLLHKMWPTGGSWISQSLSSSGSLYVALTLLAFVFVLGILGTVPDFKRIWHNVQMVSESGTFYFFAGLCLLIFAQHGSDTNEHPSITFIIAMLGIAIMLFGTGSQASGSFATQGAALISPDSLTSQAKAGGAASSSCAASADGSATLSSPSGDWGPVKANAVVAGGAAVLTALFGYGVIHYGNDIPAVFRNYDKYVRVTIRPCMAATSKPCNDDDLNAFATLKTVTLAQYSVSATNGSGNELYVRRGGRTLEILALQDDLNAGRYITIHLESSDTKGSDQSVAPFVSADIPLESGIAHSTGGGETEGVCLSEDRVTQHCHLGAMSNASSQREDNISLRTYTLDFSRLEASPPSINVDATRIDPSGAAIKYKVEIQ